MGARIGTCKARPVLTYSLEGKEMEHRHIEYAVRMAPGRDQWVWTVHTPNPRKGIVSGNRLLAISRAEKVIDAWYQRKGHLQTSVPKVNYA